MEYELTSEFDDSTQEKKRVHIIRKNKSDNMFVLLGRKSGNLLSCYMANHVSMRSR